MVDISNRALALLLVAAIVISLGGTIGVLHSLNSGVPTGMAQTGSGNVSLRVVNTISIILTAPAVVDFGSGYVNSTKCQTNATLSAGQSFNDTENNDCWTGTTSPTSLLLENDGNVNVTVDVLGPHENAFFNRTSQAGYPQNLSFRARNHEANSCMLTMQSTYINFGGVSRNVCDNLRFETNANDQIGIDIKAEVPANLGPGTYENSTIVFTAGQA